MQTTYQKVRSILCQKLSGEETSVLKYKTCYGDCSGMSTYQNNNNNNNNNNTYLLQLGCYPVAVVILHVNKT